MEKIRYKHKKSILFRRSHGEKVVFTLMFAFFFLYAASLLFPFIWLVMSSLKTGIEFADDIAMGGNAFSLPDVPQFRNYIVAFSKFNYLGVGFFGLMMNSVIYIAAVTVGSIFFPSVLGYCLSKYTFKLRGVIYGIGIFTMTIPIVGSMGAAYRLINLLGLYDTRLYLLTSLVANFGFNFLIMYGFFQNISWSYAEAVFVDGGGHFTVFFRIMLPQARPVFVVLAIMSSVGAWNEYMTMILYMPSYPTIASALYYVADTLQKENSMPIYYALIVWSILPVLVVYAIFADKMMQNMSIGGLKG